MRSDLECGSRAEECDCWWRVHSDTVSTGVEGEENYTSGVNFSFKLDIFRGYIEHLLNFLLLMGRIAIITLII